MDSGRQVAFFFVFIEVAPSLPALCGLLELRVPQVVLNRRSF